MMILPVSITDQLLVAVKYCIFRQVSWLKDHHSAAVFPNKNSVTG